MKPQKKDKQQKRKQNKPNLTEMSILAEKEFKATVTKTLTQAKRNTVRTSTTTKNRKHKNNESEIKKQCMHAQSCPALCNPMGLEPARLLCPCKFPGKEC